MMELKSPAFLIYFFFVLYLLFFLIFYLTNLKKVKSKKYENLREINDIAKRFKIDKKEINYKKEIVHVALINGFIVSSVGVFVTYLEIPSAFQLALGFILLLALTYSLYEMYGRFLKRKVNTK